MSATTWQLLSPKYAGGDAESSHVNGELEWPCDVPAFDCAACRRARSGDDERQVPLWLSAEDRGLLGGHDDFDTPEEHDEFMEALVQRVAGDPRNAAFVAGWRERRTVVPLPVTLSVPAAPTAAVLHPSGEVLVRADVADAMMAMGVVGAQFAAVARVEVSDRGRQPPSAKFRRAPDGAVAQQYALLIVTEVTGPPVGVTRRQCHGCRRVVSEWKQRRLVLPHGSWREGVDFAFLATTRNVLVSERVKQALERESNANVAFESVPVG